jgi:stage III sporulation protein AF
MIESLKEWIVNICSAVIFITAVEMILPDNDMKKYGKFVLGLILVLILLNPIIKLFNKASSVNNYLTETTALFSTEKFSDKLNTAQENSIETTKNIFKENLQKKCMELLLKKYPKDKFDVSIEISSDAGEKKYIIKSIEVNLSDSTLKKVGKVQINKNDTGGRKKQIFDESRAADIKEVLSREMDISKDIIYVFKQ